MKSEEVKWGVNGVINIQEYYVTIIKMDQMIGNDLQKGLENLKAKMEQK